jgi:predicted nuclease of predicted toxin-antitoxin system
MAAGIKFKTDENIHPDFSKLLQENGYDSTTIWDQDLRGTNDRNLLSICTRESRILVTFDLDFCNIKTYPPESYCGIIVLRISDQSRAAVLKAAGRILQAINNVDLVRALWIVDDVRIRRRS